MRTIQIAAMAILLVAGPTHTGASSSGEATIDQFRGQFSADPQLVRSNEGTDQKIKLDRFQLWNKCEPINLFVAKPLPEAIAIGVTREAVERNVRSRLRAGRIYSANAPAQLYVNAYVHSDAFAIFVRFRKPVIEPASQSAALAATWHNGSAGTYGSGGGGYVLSAVASHIDRFIDEYFRVNQEVCSR